jgi:hypothetical protein
VNTWSTAAPGSIECDTGASETCVPLESDIYLTGGLCRRRELLPASGRESG